MKKKLLIALFTVLTLCLFALSVSAANEVTLVSGEQVDFEVVFKVEKSGSVENVVRGFNAGYTKNSVTDVIFPDYLAGIECNGLFGGYDTPASTTINTLTFAATDEFFISGDNIFSGIPLTKVTFDPNCVVELRKGNFSGCTSLTEITFPKFKMLAGNAFSGCSNMVATNELVLAEGMTVIGKCAFDGCTSLRGTVYFPSTLEEIVESAFRKTGFDNFDLSKCVNLSKVGYGGGGGPFDNSDNITTLDLSACVKLLALNKSFAESCDSLTTVILPPNLETIPYKAFAHCYKLQSIVLPASLQRVDDEAFHSTRRGQDIMTFTIYVQSNVVFHDSYAFRDSGAKIEFVLIGDGVTAESLIAANTFVTVTGATVVDYKESYNYTVGQTISSHTIVANYCTSLALQGVHAFNNDNPCVVNCTVCALATVKENPEHALAVSIVYEKGYDNEGVKLTACTNDGCPHKLSDKAEALFSCLGYSASNFGNVGIAVGYSVNSTAISDYTKITGATVKYGVFAVSQEKLGDNAIFGKDGALADGVLNVEVSKHGFDVFEIKVVGFKDDQKDKKIAFGAYATMTKEGVTEYAYMQYEAPSQGDKYSFVSYNDVMAILPKE